MHPELIERRTHWYAAYVAGDTEALASVESLEMVVISPQGAEPAAERAQAIARAIRSGRWFPTGSHAIDQHITWRALSATVASAHGRGHIVTPRGPGPALWFSELWQHTSAGWQVVQLHYSEQQVWV